MHTFYNTSGLTIETKVDLLKSAKELSRRWWVDVLNMGNARRELVEMSFDEMVSKLNNKCHFVVIMRNNPFNDESYGEIGFSTIMDNPECFLFIELEFKNMVKILNKYNIMGL